MFSAHKVKLASIYFLIALLLLNFGELLQTLLVLVVFLIWNLFLTGGSVITAIELLILLMRLPFGLSGKFATTYASMVLFGLVCRYLEKNSSYSYSVGSAVLRACQGAAKGSDVKARTACSRSPSTALAKPGLELFRCSGFASGPAAFASP